MFIYGFHYTLKRSSGIQSQAFLFNPALNTNLYAGRVQQRFSYIHLNKVFSFLSSSRSEGEDVVLFHSSIHEAGYNIH